MREPGPQLKPLTITLTASPLCTLHSALRSAWEGGLELGLFVGCRPAPKYKVLALFSGLVTTEEQWERWYLLDRARFLYTAEARCDGGDGDGGALLVDSTLVHGPCRFLNDYRLRESGRGQLAASRHGGGGGATADSHHGSPRLAAAAGRRSRCACAPPNAAVVAFQVADGLPCVCLIAAQDIGPMEQILVS